MELRYLYLDDDISDDVNGLAKKLSIPGELNVEYRRVKVFDEQVAEIIAESENINGLILDLRLDQQVLKTDEDGNRIMANYTATTLCQHLRTKVYDSDAPTFYDFPIMLCSQEKKIGLYFHDSTSHDLFDNYFRKEDIEDKELRKSISAELIDLSNGYYQINDILKKVESWKEVWSNILQYDIQQLNSRIFIKFVNKEGLAPHEYARHLLKEMLRPTTDLINEEILAARLGIDFRNSDDWQTLLNTVFVAARYRGVFCTTYPRWWQGDIQRIFEELTGLSLTSIEGPRRTQEIINKTGIKLLEVANPIRADYSTYYWTICQSYRLPLDPFDGYRLASSREPLSFQEYDYISPIAVLERRLKTQLNRSLLPDDERKFKLKYDDIE